MRHEARHESGLTTLAANFGLVCTSAEVLDAWPAERWAEPRPMTSCCAGLQTQPAVPRDAAKRCWRATRHPRSSCHRERRATSNDASIASRRHGQQSDAAQSTRGAEHGPVLAPAPVLRQNPGPPRACGWLHWCALPLTRAALLELPGKSAGPASATLAPPANPNKRLRASWACCSECVCDMCLSFRGFTQHGISLSDSTARGLIAR
jgi:hypothetical protein